MKTKTTEQIFIEIMNKISNKNALSKNAISSGIHSLNNTIGGWEHGVSIISARPSIGLTSFCLSQVHSLIHTLKDDDVIIYVADKDSPTVLIQRLLAIATQLELSKIQNGDLTKQEIAQIASDPITKHLEANRLIFLTNTDSKVLHIRSFLFNLIKVGKKPKMLFVDSLQSIIDRSRDRGQDISNVMMDVNLLSQEYKIPVLLTIPLRSRLVEFRETKFPRLTDLDSRLTNEADVVLFLTRADYYEIIDLPEDIGDAHLIIAKNEGPLNILKLKMNKKNLAISENLDIFPYSQI